METTRKDAREVKIGEAIAVFSLLGGKSAVEAIIEANRPIPPVKYSRYTLGQIAEAIPNMLGGEEVIDGLLEGRLKVERVDDTLVIKPAVRSLFDRHGRPIPPDGLRVTFRNNFNFGLPQPSINYGYRIARLADVGLATSITGSSFESIVRLLLSQLQDNEQTAKSLNGVWLPVVIPRTVFDDYGKVAERFISAAAFSYRQQFPRRTLINHLRGQLKEQIITKSGSRHYDELVTKVADNSVVGIYFPNPFHGFPIRSQLEQMNSLPKGFVLSGVIDTAIGWIMYSDFLGRDSRTPVYVCSANRWREDSLLCFSASDTNASFSQYLDSAVAVGRSSGGLLYIGQ